MPLTSHTRTHNTAGTSFITDRNGKPVKAASIFGRGLPPWIAHTLGHTFLAGACYTVIRLQLLLQLHCVSGSTWVQLLARLLCPPRLPTLRAT